MLPIFATKFCGKTVLAGQAEIFRGILHFLLVEEALQKEVCYPDYDKHHAKHEEFKQTIQELNEMLQEEEGPSDAFVRKVEEHVVKWFYRHISSFDRSVAEYINMRENGGRL